MAQIILPRFIRLKDAPFYLGMDKNRFGVEVRPFVTEIKIGEQGIAFDRLELDAWADQYKARNGRLGQPQGEIKWDVKKQQGSIKGLVSGTSTNKYTGGEFVAALEQINL